MLNSNVRKEKYKMFEKDAKYTEAQSIFVSWKRTAMPVLAVCATYGLLIGVLSLDGSAEGFVAFAKKILGGVGTGAFIATLVFGVVMLTAVSMQKGMRINSPADCTDELARKLTAKSMPVNGRFTQIMPTLMLSSFYSLRGDNASAARVLLDYNRNIFYDNPFAADQFYSLLVGVYTESDDLASAEAAYKEGEYFLHTYINSPSMRGVAVKSSTACLECLRGNYAEAVRLGSECTERYRREIKKQGKKKGIYSYSLKESLGWLSRAYAGSGQIAEAQACLDEAVTLPQTLAAVKLIHNAEAAIAEAKSAEK